MAALYPGTSVSGYNSNPPPDDGTLGANNQITWSGVKSKLGDPLNSFATSVDANLTTAFNKTVGGASVVSTASNYPMTAADQGRLISATAAVTITTPDATVVHSPFCFAVNNESAVSITLAGFSAQNVDGTNTQTILAGGGCIVWTDGSNWFTSGLTPGQLAISLKPQGYLNLANDATNPIQTGDVSAATAVYYTPYEGNLAPIYNGTLLKNFSFSQMTLTLVANHTASTLYDAFLFLNAGVVTIGTGPAWNTSTAGAGARGTGAGTTELQRVNGLWTNKNSMTLRNGATTYAGIAANQATYLGSIFIDTAAGQVTCHRTYGQSRKWGVWNAYNRLPVFLKCGDATASWTYNSATIRQSRATAGNTLAVFCGLAEEVFDIRFNQTMNANAGIAFSAIGWNSTTVQSGQYGLSVVTAAGSESVMATFQQVPSLGLNNVNALESGNAGPPTFFGAEAQMCLMAFYRA